MDTSQVLEVTQRSLYIIGCWLVPVKSLELLAVYVVSIEAVSGSISLLNREITGNFLAFGPDPPLEGRNKVGI